MIYGRAGDDSNYSVSSVQVYTAKAKTACGYASDADSDQNFSCTYAGPMSAQLTGPSSLGGSLAVQFTVYEASAYLRCTNGVEYGSTGTVASIQDGTTCSALLNITNPTAADFCSGSCGSGEPANVLTYGQLSDTPTFVLDPSSLACNHGTGNLTDGLIEAVEVAAGRAVQQFFNALPLSHNSQLHTPWIPSGSCATTLETSNTQVQGMAPQG